MPCAGFSFPRGLWQWLVRDRAGVPDHRQFGARRKSCGFIADHFQTIGRRARSGLSLFHTGRVESPGGGWRQHRRHRHDHRKSRHQLDAVIGGRLTVWGVIVLSIRACGLPCAQGCQCRTTANDGARSRDRIQFGGGHPPPRRRILRLPAPSRSVRAPPSTACGEQRYVAFELSDELGTFRTRANHAHVTEQHGPKVRQFIKMRLTQHAPDPGDAGIVPGAPLRASRFRIVSHCPKFRQAEQASATTLTDLRIEDGRAGLQQDRDRRPGGRTRHRRPRA